MADTELVIPMLFLFLLSLFQVITSSNHFSWKCFSVLFLLNPSFNDLLLSPIHSTTNFLSNWTHLLLHYTGLIIFHLYYTSNCTNFSSLTFLYSLIESLLSIMCFLSPSSKRVNNSQACEKLISKCIHPRSADGEGSTSKDCKGSREFGRILKVLYLD